MNTVKVKNLVIGEGIPKICVSITGENKETIQKELENLRKIKPDLAEWRVDCYKDGKQRETIWEMLKTINDKVGDIPLIFTFRTKGEGGNQEIRYSDYVNLLLEAAQSGLADIIDLEVFFREEEAEGLIRRLHEKGVFVLASNHHFRCTPNARELTARMKKMDAWGADILKMAVMPASRLDLCPLLEATILISQECRKPVVTMSMGKTGVLSRLWGEFTGSSITFAAGSRASAPGQIEASQMRQILEQLHQGNHGEN